MNAGIKVFITAGLLVAGGCFAAPHVQQLVETHEAFASALGAYAEARGGPDGLAEDRVAFDAAAAAGVPLSEAGLSDAEVSEFQRQGVDTVIDCGSASVDPAISQINALMVEAGEGVAIPCGAKSS